MAWAINCLHPVQGRPCGKCESCKRLMGENSLDILEIDAASNNGVDEIRDLRETVKYPPQYGKYKVYIIDEVHMLSASAFNALLKTLEEPPAHVVFILATTEPQRRSGDDSVPVPALRFWTHSGGADRGPFAGGGGRCGRYGDGSGAACDRASRRGRNARRTVHSGYVSGLSERGHGGTCPQRAGTADRAFLVPLC